MGADLLIAVAVIDKDKQPDYEAGKRWVDACPAEILLRGYEEVTGVDEVELAEVREFAKGRIDELAALIEDGGRTVTLFEVRGAKVYLAGGMSWGDSPSDEFEVINDLHSFMDWDYEARRLGPYGSLMATMGFE